MLAPPTTARHYCLLYCYIGYVGSKSFLEQLRKLVLELRELNKDVKFGTYSYMCLWDVY